MDGEEHEIAPSLTPEHRSSSSDSPSHPIRRLLRREPSKITRAKRYKARRKNLAPELVFGIFTNSKKVPKAAAKFLAYDKEAGKWKAESKIAPKYRDVHLKFESESENESEKESASDNEDGSDEGSASVEASDKIEPNSEHGILSQILYQTRFSLLLPQKSQSFDCFQNALKSSSAAIDDSSLVDHRKQSKSDSDLTSKSSLPFSPNRFSMGGTQYVGWSGVFRNPGNFAAGQNFMQAAATSNPDVHETESLSPNSTSNAEDDTWIVKDLPNIFGSPVRKADFILPEEPMEEISKFDYVSDPVQYVDFNSTPIDETSSIVQDIMSNTLTMVNERSGNAETWPTEAATDIRGFDVETLGMISPVSLNQDSEGNGSENEDDDENEDDENEEDDEDIPELLVAVEDEVLASGIEDGSDHVVIPESRAELVDLTANDYSSSTDLFGFLKSGEDAKEASDAALVVKTIIVSFETRIAETLKGNPFLNTGRNARLWPLEHPNYLREIVFDDSNGARSVIQSDSPHFEGPFFEDNGVDLSSSENVEEDYDNDQGSDGDVGIDLKSISSEIFEGKFENNPINPPEFQLPANGMRIGMVNGRLSFVPDNFNESAGEQMDVDDEIKTQEDFDEDIGEDIEVDIDSDGEQENEGLELRKDQEEQDGHENDDQQVVNEQEDEDAGVNPETESQDLEYPGSEAEDFRDISSRTGGSNTPEFGNNRINGDDVATGTEQIDEGEESDEEDVVDHESDGEEDADQDVDHESGEEDVDHESGEEDFDHESDGDEDENGDVDQDQDQVQLNSTFIESDPIEARTLAGTGAVAPENGYENDSSSLTAPLETVHYVSELSSELDESEHEGIEANGTGNNESILTGDVNDLGNGIVNVNVGQEIAEDVEVENAEADGIDVNSLGIEDEHDEQEAAGDVGIANINGDIEYANIEQEAAEDLNAEILQQDEDEHVEQEVVGAVEVGNDQLEEGAGIDEQNVESQSIGIAAIEAESVGHEAVEHGGANHDAIRLHLVNHGAVRLHATGHCSSDNEILDHSAVYPSVVEPESSGTNANSASVIGSSSATVNDFDSPTLLFTANADGEDIGEDDDNDDQESGEDGDNDDDEDGDGDDDDDGDFCTLNKSKAQKEANEYDVDSSSLSALDVPSSKDISGINLSNLYSYGYLTSSSSSTSDSSSSQSTSSSSSSTDSSSKSSSSSSVSGHWSSNLPMRYPQSLPRKNNSKSKSQAKPKAKAKITINSPTPQCTNYEILKSEDVASLSSTKFDVNSGFASGNAAFLWIILGISVLSVASMSFIIKKAFHKRIEGDESGEF